MLRCSAKAIAKCKLAYRYEEPSRRRTYRPIPLTPPEDRKLQTHSCSPHPGRTRSDRSGSRAEEHQRQPVHGAAIRKSRQAPARQVSSPKQTLTNLLSEECPPEARTARRPRLPARPFHIEIFLKSDKKYFYNAFFS